MNPVAAVLVLAGSFLAVLAGVGLMRFATPYARFHSAGKASPVAFVLVAAGASVELGGEAAIRLAVATSSLVLTLPVGVHLLFRAVHRTDPSTRPRVDQLAPAERVGDGAPGSEPT